MAQYKARHSHYQVIANSEVCNFRPNGFFETEDPAKINSLANNSKFNIDFFRIDEGGNANEEEWRDHLKATDDMDTWSTNTIKAFREGKDVYRCPNECGFASYRKQLVTRHAEECPEGE